MHVDSGYFDVEDELKPDDEEDVKKYIVEGEWEMAAPHLIF
jgi:hypothetical protein